MQHIKLMRARVNNTLLMRGINIASHQGNTYILLILIFLCHAVQYVIREVHMIKVTQDKSMQLALLIFKRDIYAHMLSANPFLNTQLNLVVYIAG